MNPTSWNQQYGYDSLNRLTQVHEYTGNTSLDWQQSYSYDRWGNRLINNNGSATWGQGINNVVASIDPSNNRMYATNDPNHTIVDYDLAGNQTKDYLTSNGTRSYDAENRMVLAVNTANQTSAYSYDGDGHRVKRNISNTETWQVYGLGGELIAEYAQNGSPTSPQKEYGYRNGQLLVTATVTTGWGSAPTPNDNPLSVGQTTVQARHISELRDAINALRSHLGMSAYSWQYSATTNDYISANPILEMRTALDQALGAPSGGYSAGLAQNQLVMAIHIQELRNRVLAAWQSGSGVDIRWLVTDQLGTPRMVFDKTGSLSGVSRHDYLPFGEELSAGTGGRTSTEGYNTDNVRQHFTHKERDIETGLDYFGARYYASTQARFTSADSFFGSRANPQSLNRYAYVLNNPLKYTDPTGHYADGGPYFGNGRSFGEGVGLAGALSDPWSEIPWTVAGEHVAYDGSTPPSLSEDEALNLAEQMGLDPGAPQNSSTTDITLAYYIADQRLVVARFTQGPHDRLPVPDGEFTINNVTSGLGNCMNDPGCIQREDTGPIPPGVYEINT